jgi:hypothetical protein
MSSRHLEPTNDEWISFPGGELEGKRPKALCSDCREALKRAAASGRSTRHPAPGTQHAARSTQHPAPSTRRTLCFACYRAELDRQKAIAAAGQLETATDARFQYQLPFEPVDQPRLEMLKADRLAARAADRATPTGAFVDRRRQAQIDARHALQRLAAGLRAREMARAERDRAMASVFHAAELQLPDAWIPFVMAR